jgi:hypothetical protein
LQAVRLLAALLEPHECAACVCLLMRELARRARCSFALPPSAAQPSSCVFLALAAALCGQPPVLAAWAASTGLHQDLEAFLSRKQPNATDLAQVRFRPNPDPDPNPNPNRRCWPRGARAPGCTRTSRRSSAASSPTRRTWRR